jgi:hypothetical protein
MTPAEEYTLGKAQMDAFWAALRKACPKAKFVEINSNHQDRLQKRILDRLPEVETLVDETKLHSPGVTYVEQIVFDDCLYIHGHFSRAVDHARYYQMNVVHGHTHCASLQVLKNRNGAYWNLECGNVLDQDQTPFSYKQKFLTQWTHAAGLVVDGVPQLLLYPHLPPKASRK